jgi:hypothetical protein
MKKYIFLWFILLSLMGCGEGGQAAPTLAITPLPTAVAQLPPTFTPPQPFERLFPTFPAVTVTQRPLPTDTTNTPIPFGDTTIEVRYSIPALGLDRRLQGSVSSQIILVDEVTGQAVKRANQGGALLELQQVLPDLLLPVVPDGCNACVHISYDLPFSNLHNEGWLRDPVLLASLENYFASSLGPHFPEGTVVGLRRSASPFAPAHTAAVLEDGRTITWLATESEVSEPITGTADIGIIETLTNLSLEGLSTEYTAACAGYPLESLFVKQGEQTEIIGIYCPEYALPSTLLPLYTQLDGLLVEKLTQSDTVLERPPAAFPLTAVLDYNRVDGTRLTLYADGTAVAQNADGETTTSVISPTQSISLTHDLIASGAVRTGLRTFRPETSEIITTTAGVTTTITTTPLPPRTTLLVRGPAGVYDGEWFNTFEVTELAALNELLEQLLGSTAVPTDTQTPTAEGTGTPIIAETETPEIGQTGTPTRTSPPSPTP